MEDFKVRSCKLCSAVIKDEEYEMIDNNSKDSLVFHLFKLDYDDERKHVICNVCSIELFAAQNFKMTCLYTENVINSFIKDTTVLPLDLKEIYMNERDNKHVLEDTKICRLCMEPINNLSEFISINEEQVDMIQKLVPEIHIFKIKNPVVCKLCLDSLSVHCNFLKKCSDSERTTGNISNGRIMDAPPPEPSVDISVKIEDVDIELEQLPELIKTECLYVNYEDIKTESDIQGHEISSKEPAACKNQEMRTIQEDPLAPQMYKCETCNYATEHKKNLKRHMMIHKSSSEVQMHKCEYCSYETKHKHVLKSHILKHKDPTEVQMYKCKNCSYETRHKNVLRIHILIHKDPTEVQMFKCEHCGYETKHKNVLRNHIIMHKDPTQVQMHKCENCNFETKYKYGLKRHMMLHKSTSEVQMHECKICNFKTKHRNNFKKHILKHKDPSEVQIYKCESCDYETKHKAYLKDHMLVHKGPAEVQMCKCEHCDYETKYRQDLRRHIKFIHKRSSEVRM